MSMCGCGTCAHPAEQWSAPRYGAILLLASGSLQVQSMPGLQAVFDFMAAVGSVCMYQRIGLRYVLSLKATDYPRLWR